MAHHDTLTIRNRDGSLMPLDFSYVELRIRQIADGENLFVREGTVAAWTAIEQLMNPLDHVDLAEKHIPDTHRNRIIGRIMQLTEAEVDKLTVTILDTATIDNIVVRTCIGLSEVCADCGLLARALDASNMQKSRARIQPLSIEGYLTGMQRSNQDPYTYEILSWIDERTACALKGLSGHNVALPDYRYDFTIPAEGLITLRNQSHQKSLKSDGKRAPFELPSEMYLRMAIQLAPNRLPSIEDLGVNYFYLANRLITMSTPVMSRSGTRANSLAACYLTFGEDSIDSISDRIKATSRNSAGGGGIAIDVSSVRERGGYIRTTGGEAQGVLQCMGPFAAMANFVSQGARRGSTAVYLADHHPEALEFAEARSETTPGIKHHTLFTGIMLSDLLIRRCTNPDATWTFFPPVMVPDLVTLWGDAFERQYVFYERKYASHALVKRVNARDFMLRVMTAKIETGMPYLISKSHVYEFSNQKHMVKLFPDGRIVLNLCTEIMLFMRRHETAVCILGTVLVGMCVHWNPCSYPNPLEVATRLNKPLFDFTPLKPLVAPRLLERFHPELIPRNEGDSLTWLNARRLHGKAGAYVDLLELGYSAYQCVIMLNNVFEHNQYAEEGARTCSLRDRPIGVGQQGLFDLYTMMMVQADTPQGRHINRVVQGVIYGFALLASADVARSNGHPYETFACRKHRFVPPATPCDHCSPLAHGMFQFDIRNAYIRRRLAQLKPTETPTRNRWGEDLILIEPIDEFDWDRLRTYIGHYGVANSMLTSIQPTETSAKIGCISEMCEPRRGVKITIVNEHQTTVIRHPHLVRLCNELGLDIAAITRYIDEHDGSIWGCPAFPDHLQLLFRGIYEYDQRFLIDLTSDREAYIDLAQSHSVYLKQPKVVDALGHTLYAHRKLLKTLSYYMRSPAATTLRATGGQYSGLKSLAPRKDESCEGCST